MLDEARVSQEEVDRTYERLNREALSGGYHLNPDVEFTKSLIRGILINQSRYGYWNCPCRLASGSKQADLDIICPCDYRDADVDQYGCCYCALYVSEAAVRGEQRVGSIPERRPPPAEREQAAASTAAAARKQTALSSLSQPVWRCKVCGYLCARGEPPEVCPICKAKKERFERFI